MTKRAETIPSDRRRISPKELAAKGWTRIEKHPFRDYVHRDGWYIEHCGHPTANYPYMLTDVNGCPVMAYNGRAWETVAQAVDYVATQTNRAIPSLTDPSPPKVLC